MSREDTMIIDAHIHAFPHFGGASGYTDVRTHLMIQQSTIQRFWGRMISNTFDKEYMPHPGEDVNFRVGKYGQYYWTKHGKECWLRRFPSIMLELEWPPEHMIAHMDAIGVDKGVLQAGYMEINYCRKYFADCIKRWPDRFIGTIAIDYDIEKSEAYREAELEKLKESVLNLGARGVFQGFPRDQRDRMDDKRFDPFWEEIARLGIPHIFVVGFEPKEKYLASLDRLEKVLGRFRELKAIIGHLGGNIRPPRDPNFTGTPEDLLKILRHPNAYFEVGYVLAYENWEAWKENYEYPYPLHTEIIRRIYEEVGAERLLWGSDMPNIYRTCTYQQCLDLVRLHMDFLNDEEKAMVLGNNAARVFGIET